MALRVYNTLGRSLESFAPLHPPRVGMYVCGPTVYGHSHLGHAKSYIAFDAVVRWLRHSGYEVNYVQNITDVGHLTDDADEGEDKVVAEARRRGQHPMAVVEIFLRSYLDDMDALNLQRPDIMPRAAGHVPEQIEQIKAILARGHAYEVGGSVYFDVSSFPEYGRLSGRKTAELEAGARVAVNEEKRQPSDFALWKRAEPGHVMRWLSPWGEGFPGWHIECSAMSQKYLGETFDIHGGGLENQFPHHECEIAQARAATGKPFARYWLHNNMCTINGQKMGKSLGNSVYLKDIFYTQAPLISHDGSMLLARSFEPAVVKHFVLTSHYRQNLDFSNEALQAAESGSYRLRDAWRGLLRAASCKEEPRASARAVATNPTDAETGTTGILRLENVSDSIRAALTDLNARFCAAMDDDFNTAAALAVLFELVRESNRWIAAGTARSDLLAAAGLLDAWVRDVFGLRWQDAPGGGPHGREDQLIQLLADLRNDARKGKNFALSDAVRNGLANLGIELRDTPEGTRW